MQKKSTNTIFVILFLFALCIFFLSKVVFLQGIYGVVSFFTSPLQYAAFSLFHSKNDTGELVKVQKENEHLIKQLVDQKKLITENNALKDQFKINKPPNMTLLPAQVIGAPGFFPGVTEPEKLILNIGQHNGVFQGDVVVVNNNLVGSIDRVSYSLAVVLPVSSFTRAFTAKTLETNATGLIIVNNEGIRLDNVVLSDTLKKGDIVMTKGDVDERGNGFLPDIVVGKIISVDKKPSALFQSAKVQPLVELSNVTTVFIIQSHK